MKQSRLQRDELERLERSRYAQRLGFIVERCSAGSAVVVLPVRPQSMNRGGMVHGGAIASGALCSALLAAASSETRRDAARALPQSLSISFLAPVRDAEVAFGARVLRRGRSLVHLTVEASAGADVVASALAVYRIAAAADLAGAELHAATPRALGGGLDAAAPAVRMSGSPYGADAGIEVLSELGSEARLRMPAEPNADQDGCSDPGALVGLVDNCGAFATYSHPGVSIERSGATVGLSVSFGPPQPGTLWAAGRVVARSGSSFASEIEVAAAERSAVAATASVLYRLRARER